MQDIPTAPIVSHSDEIMSGAKSKLKAIAKERSIY